MTVLTMLDSRAKIANDHFDKMPRRATKVKGRDSMSMVPAGGLNKGAHKRPLAIRWGEETQMHDRASSRGSRLPAANGWKAGNGIHVYVLRLALLIESGSAGRPPDYLVVAGSVPVPLRGIEEDNAARLPTNPDRNSSKISSEPNGLKKVKIFQVRR